MTRILIIDDSPEDREWLADLLHTEGGFSVTDYASGVDGLQHIEEHGADCVLLDWRLNGEDGMAILATLKASTLFLPVIIMTGEGNETLAAQAIKVGASNYLTKKGLTETKLAGVIKATVDKVQTARNSFGFKADVSSVLLVEDNDDDRAHIEQMIVGLDGGYAVASFATGTESLAYFKEHGADCIILDYRLEVEDGLTILAELKKIFTYVPVIMLTGQGNEEVAAQSIKVGAADYLIKQRLNTTYLRSAIDNAMSRAALEEKIADQELQRLRFLSTLVHDLRAPLINVRQLGQLAVEDAQGGDLEGMQKLLYSQSSVANRATELIDTLEIYALLDGEVSFEKTSLTLAAEAARDNLATIIAERQAEVMINDMPFVHGQAPQLTQLFQNLIGNGLKYNKSDCPKVSIGSENESTKIVVRDNGIGIPKKHQKAIFAPLKRLWGSDHYEGTGLGLAICQKIVERHQGTISCSSTEGDGSTFHINFPRMTNAASDI